MDWLTMKTALLGLGGVGLVAGLGALAILNPMAGLKLASQVSGFVLDAVRRLVEWVRDPARDWWKIGCLTFSGLFAVAAIYANDQRGDVQEVSAKFQALTVADELLIEELAASKLWASVLEAQLKAEIGKQQETARLNAEAVATVQAKAAQAARAAADWKRRYADRPNTCKAAQAALEDACGTLSDF